jgi:sialate O-acetylesterase
MITVLPVKSAGPSREDFMCRPNAAFRVALTLLAWALPALAQATRPAGDDRLTMPHIFTNGMVMQRDHPITLWGWSAPGSTVTARIDRDVRRVKADRSGAWIATLSSRRAGGPVRVVVAAGADSLVFSNVLVGDVWVASGQSNMEFPVSQAANANEAIAAANDSTIREFKVPNSWANAPERDLAGGAWLPADRQHVGAFSAVAYFYARHLQASVRVPIGIINTTWGGSNIETWISRDAQHLTDSAWSAVQQGEANRDRAVRDSLRAALGSVLPEVDSGLVGGVARWADPSLDDHDWKSIRVPAYWESQGYPGLDGVAWYRVDFTLDAAQIQSTVVLKLAAIDDDDVTWVNGVEVGHTSGYNVRRSYDIPASALHAGRNVLAIRVTDYSGGGGINESVALVVGGTPKSLDGSWKFKVGRVTIGTDGQRINKIPTVLYNKMVYPMLRLAIKGVLWYQGESNANNAQQAMDYRAQFSTLIRSWRREWSGGQNQFPFLWVQLPGYGKPDSVPQIRPGWALQRESMEAALTLPKTGRAIAIDLGGAAELHPRNKEDVGARLALVGRKVAYGETIEASGPTFESMTMRGDTAVLTFAHVGKGLVVRGEEVGGFAIASTDQHFVWGRAKIVGNRVYVWSDQVRSPAAVRYAWANYPERANVYGANGLPAAPFRTDHW